MARLGGVDEDIHGCFVKSSYLFIRNPVNETKHLLVSWRMSGSEFSKELIRENFPECVDRNYWGKTHIPLPDEMLHLMRNTDMKVFFILNDPRDAATHIAYHENGMHKNPGDYTQKAFFNPQSIEFLNENIEKIIELIKFYQKNFKNFIVLKYEDAVYNQQFFLKQVSNFMGVEPLNIDDTRKYKSIIFKQIGVFDKYYDKEIIQEHYNKYNYFYKKWGYPENGCQSAKNIVNNEVYYLDFLDRNNLFSNKIPFNPKNGTLNKNNLIHRINGITNI